MTGEIKLDNILLNKDRVVFIDLELDEIVDCMKSWKLWRRSSIEQLCRYYNIWLKDDWIMYLFHYLFPSSSESYLILPMDIEQLRYARLFTIGPWLARRSN